MEAIEREGGAALFVKTDVREAREVQHLVASAVEIYGGMHFAFNNAGVLPAGVCCRHGGRRIRPGYGHGPERSVSFDEV